MGTRRVTLLIALLASFLSLVLAVRLVPQISGTLGPTGG